MTVGTGNWWLKQETAEVLKLLEVIGRPRVPVYMGAEFPLVMPPQTPVLLTKLCGGSRTDPFLGAYAEFSPGPDVVTPPPGGFAKIQPQKGHAAEFIIKSIRENPNQVAHNCRGALTNVALAISLDPGIVPLTKEITFMGTSPEFQPKTVNVIYDSESAKIVSPRAMAKTDDLHGRPGREIATDARNGGRHRPWRESAAREALSGAGGRAVSRRKSPPVISHAG